jgi:hypothetical protein
MLVTLNEIVDIFGGNGAIIFNKPSVTLHPFHTKSVLVEHNLYCLPQFHIVSCHNIRQASSCPSKPAPVLQLLVVTEHVRLQSELLRCILFALQCDTFILTIHDSNHRP